MALLNLKAFGQPAAWLIVDIQPMMLEPDDPDYGWSDGVKARVSFFPDRGGKEFSTEFDTKRWQLGRHYFQTLAYAFVRADQFAHTQFPLSYYDDDTEHRNDCTLHISTGNFHVLIRGIGHFPKRPPGEDSVQIHCFVQEAASGLYARFAGNCSISAAERFGNELLRELEAVKEYDTDSTGESS